MDLIPIDKEIQKKIYDDLFSPPLKEAWDSLRNIIWLVTVITLPILYAKKWTNKVLDNNLKNYQEKVLEIPANNRIVVQPEIGVPILEKLNHYSNIKLVNLFTELLAKASDKDNVAKVHPKYISIVENLSEDEAVILEYISKNDLLQIPMISVHSKKVGKVSYVPLLENYSVLSNISWLNFKENIDVYLSNLVSLWIIEISTSKFLSDENMYKSIISSDKVNVLKPRNWEEIDIQKWVIEIKWFWTSFLDAIFNV